MKAVTILSIFGCAAVTFVGAAPAPAPVTPNPNFGLGISDLSGTAADQHPHVFTAEEIHSNILKTFPADQIIVSGQLEQYRAQHNTSLVYLSDSREFVEIVPVTDRLVERAGCVPDVKYQVLSSQGYWDPWIHLSGCRYTGKSDAGADYQINWSYSKSSYHSFDLSVSNILGIMGGSLGFGVTETYTNGGAFTCHINANSVGQVWGRHYIGWTEIKKTNCCVQCITTVGYVTAPKSGDTAQALGCSTGDNNVNCQS
ncbi:hypothetical protein NKR23_g10178 [Pleurostoma richardsiae]|uniref:Secreted protein n=1 Tax=Pleurostoma richardsiae TaxID=41990 RepID=A0AA38RF31_9PEZI|nr:hypothetical protein NKR23_g10178 [Pleurostoma richardsiae]